MITGIVDKMISAPLFGGLICRIRRIDQDNSLLKIKIERKVDYYQPSLGEKIEVVGRVVSDSFGIQCVATQILPALPCARSLKALILKSPYFADQLPLEIIRKMCRLNQELLYDALLPVDVAILESLIGNRNVIAFARCWSTYVQRVNTVRFLCNRGVPAHSAVDAAYLWGVDANRVATSDPYALLAVAPWRNVDNAALEFFRVELASKLRLTGACLSVCYEALDQGELSISEKEMFDKLGKKLGPLIAPADALRAALQSGWIQSNPRVASTYQCTGALKIENAIRKLLSREPETSRESTAARPRHVTLEEFLAGTSIVAFIQVHPYSIPLLLEILLTRLTNFVYVGSSSNGTPKELKILSIAQVLSDKFATPSANTIVVLQNLADLDAISTLTILEKLHNISRILILLPLASHAKASENSTLKIIIEEDQIPILTDESISRAISADEKLKTVRTISLEEMQTSAASSGLSSHLLVNQEILFRYREVFEGDPLSVVIITKTWEEASSFNMAIHSELASDLMGQNDSPPSVRVGHGDERVMVGDTIVCRSRLDTPNATLYPGMRGSVIKVPNTLQSKLERLDPRSVVVVNFIGIGEVALTQPDCKHIRLGHAIPLRLATWGPWLRTVVPVQRNDTDKVEVIRLSAVSSLQEAIIVEGT